ncbi:hypothetical protein [Noviherbaspirillum denitrificans]|uniref:hypothetical protein n=1 Tax=Noviherbaspirillum denitrificans TaxID=1968433 RepID=UPI001131D64A|nr:hypothetical protein [Noviherbaspirillum denitrificans]
MSLLPGREGIAEDILLVCALAQAAFVTGANYTALPYLEHLVHDRASQSLIERLLSIAIRTRFLDDRTKLLKLKDRRQILIGRYTEDGVEKASEVCIRLALNKLVHHNSISVAVEDFSCIVVVPIEPYPSDMKLIPAGPHKGKRVIVSVEGEHRGAKWLFAIDLYKLMDEMLRVLE